MDKSIIPECFADTLLIETLVPTKRGYNHQHNCFKVESVMKGLDSFALGIIDKDKKTVQYLNEFEIVDEIKNDLILWRHVEKQIHHWIIQICPALERLILKICEAENIDVSNFGTGDLEGIKYYTKSSARLNDPKLQLLFNEINKKDNNLTVRKLKCWVRILRDKNYQADINELRNA